ncbi:MULTISPECIES: N-acetylmuramic acid 6-phosphate etherase [Methylosinus]|uniref:N-acetylmuramic acid 6-phosphate etherase n=1 Tax=Methylosinus trichosporium (strain ATCC 35070 / NCIMB 11131 / UNIQEM 75 / OB3b) TaxID=595536 RepID=A0A2D2D351_METT3|nr:MULTISPECIES: N-acetylmuramic acid 6-phosphate etherase [Methylosinus]ATQ69431.1 N-acetylmuramic acid 6-phosphate etherase [Methylosinus trichosporium OB3b]OBS52942.1 N-acetylmuramic acid 6-phosphate etherase [Methylosinus sp. 3S-1]
METERPSPRYSRIDAWEPAEILDAMIEGQLAAVAAVRAARASLESAALAIEQKLGAGGRLVYVGAGTSGRLAVQDGAELAPTFGWPQDKLLLLIAGGEDALLKAVEGAEDESARAIELMRRHGVGRADVLIALAASGTTPFTLACLREAKRAGALVIGVANNRDTPLLAEADHAIFLDTGPEVIAGSTRMKAGAAQRTALLLLSSLVMILLGRVFDGLMVDVQASNKKLVRRSEKILARLTGRGAEEIDAALRRSGGSVKLAFLLLQGWEHAEAEAALSAAHGHLRRAFETLDARRAGIAAQTPGGSTVGLKKPTPS